jgi:phosphohistidine swiveling domain-containing protein
MTDATTGWPAPGPGTWELDTAHFDPTVSRQMRDLISGAMEIGLGEGFELAGAPLSTIQARFVNGRMYTRLVPLVGANSSRPAPPDKVLWLVTRLHPAFRRRARQSARAIDGKFWMTEFARWEREWKPELLATNRRLGEVPVADLSTEELADHLDAVWQHAASAAALHFRLHTSDLAPIGRLLVASVDWGLDPHEVMMTLAGASPATSAPARALGEIRAELDRAGIVPETLAEVRAASAEAAVLLDEYLAEFGNRVTTGYDLRNRTLRELPDVVLSSIKASVVDLDGAQDAGDLAFAAMSNQLAAADRAEFAVLVEEARTLYGLRDENGPLTAEWPAGIARSVILEVGRRLVASGALDELEHVFDAGAEEITGLLRGDEHPLAAELAMRCNERMGWADLVAPVLLGPQAAPPPIDILPGRMPELMRAVLLVTELFDPPAPVAGSTGLTGMGVGTGTVRGIARVVADADEAFERAEPGDIIVTRLTVPTFNSVLAMAGGVVTEGGGLLSHTAVIARELGIPAIIGVAGALTDIPDGAVIELDPAAGTVTIVR